jgi:hypothetical protein
VTEDARDGDGSREPACAKDHGGDRRRIQQQVGRRFNRRRHDAAHTLQAFSARLRQQVDLDSLTGELLEVVDQTMQPTSVSLWLDRRSARPRIPVGLPSVLGAVRVCWPITNGGKDSDGRVAGCHRCTSVEP